ncbi:MAG: hypothetical protein IPJ88_01205 [Myxococcales bacterium]|nr:MAG: hypothetical protein IPJ88_01205 [Myxococcales bacterium]
MVALSVMTSNRVFLPQDAVDSWLSDRRIDIQGEIMTLAKGKQKFAIKSAVRFLRELSGQQDQANLVGKVKDMEQLAMLGAEHCADSVLLGDNAYEVVEGFVGEAISGADKSSIPTHSRPDNSVPELDLLARFFLSR